MTSVRVPDASSVFRTVAKVPVLSAVAAFALLVSLLGSTFLSLFSKTAVSFGDLRTATRPAAAPGFQRAYFGWLGWTLVLLVILGLVAVIVSQHAAAVGVMTAVVGVTAVLSLLGVILTLACVKQLDVAVDPGGSFLTHFGWIRLGGYLHVVGFSLAIAAGVTALRSAPRAT
jgi:hypothetical protein